MNLDDVACVGGLHGYLSLASNIDRNTFRIPGDVVAALINGENEFLKNMRNYNINIIGQCGETADVPDLTPTVLVNNTLHCRMEKKYVIDNGRINKGDLIVGLASFGKAIYEDEYNGGMGSNGLTLARHGVLSSEYREKYPESFYPGLGEEAYRGNKKLTDLIKVETGEQIPVGKLILSPTRTYAPVLSNLDVDKKSISGMVHNSGGGQTKVLNYLSETLRIVKDNLFPTPILFKMIQASANVDWQEMYQDFNMGHRFEIYVKDKDTADKIIRTSKSFGVDAQIIGRVEKAQDNKSTLFIHSENGKFNYSR